MSTSSPRGRITSKSFKAPNKSVSITKRVPKSAMRFNRRFFSVPDHVDNADQRKRAQLLQVRGADMRGHCRDCRDRRAGGVQAIDKAGDVAGKPRNIAVAHETEHMGDIGMN